MTQYIELNVADIKVKMLHTLKSVAEKDGFMTTTHGWDHLVIYSDKKYDDRKFRKLIKDLEYVCAIYEMHYFSLLDLD